MAILRGRKKKAPRKKFFEDAWCQFCPVWAADTVYLIMWDLSMLLCVLLDLSAILCSCPCSRMICLSSVTRQENIGLKLLTQPIGVWFFLPLSPVSGSTS
ncbi:hypothetical protein Bbelb_246140 [Branchiostoma belcheri]|nr:hypothetical protein Bbelb_246140 [Branchiostoma belcheri]